MRELLLHTSTLRKKTLAEMCASLAIWARVVKRERATLTSLNMLQFDLQRKVFVGEVWCPTAEVPKLRLALKGAAVKAGGDMNPILNELETKDTPPTFLRTNRFTSGFQGLVDTYGIPRYREVNPAVFTVVTFPFLFGVMYGDIGHATILTLASAWVVWNEKALASVRNEMFSFVYAGRYMLLMMGCFSIYCGAIYNDVFSLGAQPFVSQWRYVGSSQEATWSGKDADVHPFGLDPEWHLSENQLLFFNSLKMKLSVILGISQMTFGLLLKTSNAIHFGNTIDLYCECIPQLGTTGRIMGAPWRCRSWLRYSSRRSGVASMRGRCCTCPASFSR
jgi:V-type H+-transporting ATPase subunit a